MTTLHLGYMYILLLLLAFYFYFAILLTTKRRTWSHTHKLNGPLDHIFCIEWHMNTGLRNKSPSQIMLIFLDCSGQFFIYMYLNLGLLSPAYLFCFGFLFIYLLLFFHAILLCACDLVCMHAHVWGVSACLHVCVSACVLACTCVCLFIKLLLMN